ncbi:1-phosphofructokinase family hexose kinase [Arthrobacter globiformis]|uniref:1-phosphofructokinase family hexose kinase n=1 Tax=Arthrobacter globiformis TaxID=1665 RepID=UPI0002D2FDA1|nr:hexose kinase [Arthrobacter globiformis]
MTPNPAVDVTYHVAEEVAWDGVNRVQSVTRRAGGKGLNVASVLLQLGAAAELAGFLGGPQGEALRRLVDIRLDGDWVDIEGETRCTTAVVDTRSTTLFNEPGPAVGDADWECLTRDVAARATQGGVVVLSGSCPPGTKPEHVKALIDAAHAAGASVLADTSGPLLLEAAAAGADLLKPNREELLEATGADTVTAGATALLERGASAIAVSSGEKGLFLFIRTDDGISSWSAAPAEVVHGNPTGAGDAAVAALALGLNRIAAGADPSVAWPRTLAEAVAASAAAVLIPVAGSIDTVARERFLPNIHVKEFHVAH